MPPIWEDHLDLEGSATLAYLRNLAESRSFLTSIRDDSIIVASDQPRLALRALDRSFAAIYLVTGQEEQIDLT
jgi:hypothetical protein